MFINKLKLHNFRCFENLEIDFAKGLTVIVGNNGEGKTTILEAGVIAASSFFLGLDGIKGRSISQDDVLLKSFLLGSQENVQEQYPVDIIAEGDLGTEDEISWKRSLNGKESKTTIVDAKSIKSKSILCQEQLRNGDRTLIMPIIAYYGTGRLWDNHRAKKADLKLKSTRTNGYIDSLDGTANLKLMDDWFEKKTISKYQNMEVGMDGVYELEEVYKAMETCFSEVTGYDDIKIQYSMDRKELMVYYKTGDRGIRIPLSFLSAGYKGTISLVADIAYRMATLNPQLGDRVLKETPGIVFIDEVDLHLHPRWQQRILKDLMSIFPKVQFVVSTHAPAVINSTNSENLRVLDQQQVRGVYHEVYGDDVNSILKNIMGAEERPKELVDLFKEFYSHLEKEEFDKAEDVLDMIDKKRNYNDKELAGCRVKLKLERIRRRGVL